MFDLYIKSVELERIPHEEYPFSLDAVKNLGKLRFKTPVTFIVGENGSGKSTLMEAVAVACGFNAEGGTKNFNFSTSDTHSELHKHIRIAKGTVWPKDGFFLRAESLYNLATDMDRMDRDISYDPPVNTYYGGKSLHERSHGESFLALIKGRFGGHGLYILDEPEAALSPVSQLAMLKIINDLVALDSQFIISSHSPILTAFPGAQIFEITEAGIVETDYERTDNYLITKRFLNDRKRVFEGLF